MGRTPNTPWYFITTNKDIGIFSILNTRGVFVHSLYVLTYNSAKTAKIKTIKIIRSYSKFVFTTKHKLCYNKTQNQ